MIGADGHSEACTFRKCAHPEAEATCPFLADAKPEDGIDMPAFLPGQVLAIKLYGQRNIVTVSRCRQNDDSSWTYFSPQLDVGFRNADVEMPITPSITPSLHNRQINWGGAFSD